MYLEIMKKKKTTWVILNYPTLKWFGGQKKPDETLEHYLSL